MCKRIVSVTAILALLLTLMGCDLEREIEKVLGAIYQTFVEMSYSTSDDPLLVELTESVGRKVVEVSPRKNMPIKFRVLNTGQVNAIALPNGRIYVFRGMLEMTDTEDELAAVLAHETGHVAGRHSLKQLRLSLGISLLWDLLNLNKRGETLQTIAGLAGILYELGYSRQQEEDADNYGLRLALASGYDPKGSVELFDKFVQREGKPSRWLVYLSTHPPSTKRLERAKRANLDLGSIQRDITAFAAHTIIADGYSERGLYRHAVRHYEAALRAQQNYLPAILGLAKAKEAWGEWSEAERLYERVLEREPQNEEAKQGLERVRQAPKGTLSQQQTDEQTKKMLNDLLVQALQEWERVQGQMPSRWHSVITTTTDFSRRIQTLWRHLGTTPSPNQPITISIGKRQDGRRDNEREFWRDSSQVISMARQWDDSVEACTKALIAFQIVADEWESFHEDTVQATELWQKTLRNWQTLIDIGTDREAVQRVVDDAERSVTLIWRAFIGSEQEREDLRNMEWQISRAVSAIAEVSNITQRRNSNTFRWVAETRLRDAKASAQSAFAQARTMLSRVQEKRAQVDKALLSAYRSRLEALEMKTPRSVAMQLLAHHLRAPTEVLAAVRDVTPDLGVTALVIAFAKSHRTDPQTLVKTLDFKGDWLKALIPSRPPSGVKVALKWLTTAWEREFDEVASEKGKEQEKPQ